MCLFDRRLDSERGNWKERKLLLNCCRLKLLKKWWNMPKKKNHETEGNFKFQWITKKNGARAKEKERNKWYKKLFHLYGLYGTSRYIHENPDLISEPARKTKNETVKQLRINELQKQIWRRHTHTHHTWNMSVRADDKMPNVQSFIYLIFVDCILE